MIRLNLYSTKIIKYSKALFNVRLRFKYEKNVFQNKYIYPNLKK